MQRNRRALGIGQPRVDRQRRGLAFASNRNGVFDGEIPRVIKIEVGPGVREQRWIGESGAGVVGGIACDGQCFRDGVLDGALRKVGGVGVASPHADIHRDSYALVAVVRDRFDLAFANRDTLSEALRYLGFRCSRTAGFRFAQDVAHDLGQCIRRERKPGSGYCHRCLERRARMWNRL